MAPSASRSTQDVDPWLMGTSTSKSVRFRGLNEGFRRFSDQPSDDQFEHQAFGRSFEALQALGSHASAHQMPPLVIELHACAQKRKDYSSLTC